jgi:hypothetical protein
LQKKIIALAIITAILSGCSVSRRSGSGDSYSGRDTGSDNSVGSIVRNNISNNNFYIQRADIKVTQENISARFTAGIKFRKPDTLLIAVRSKAGIEAGRAFITRDTILLNDRINKKLLIGKPEIIESKYGIDPALIFAVLGDVIVEEQEMETSLNCVKGIYRKEFRLGNKRVEYTIDCGRMKAVRAYFEGDINTGNITIDYSNIVLLNGVRFPQRIEIVDDLNSVNILLEVKKVESPWEGRIEFIPGSGYKVMKIR